jgi:hypothetical protein
MNAERKSRSKIVPAVCLLVGGDRLLTLAWVSAGAAQVQTNPSATDARAHFGLQKNTQIKERNSLQIRIEFFNIFNHAQFENPTGTINLSTFGVVTGARPGRIGQAAVKFTF